MIPNHIPLYNQQRAEEAVAYEKVLMFAFVPLIHAFDGFLKSGTPYLTQNKLRYKQFVII